MEPFLKERKLWATDIESSVDDKPVKATGVIYSPTVRKQTKYIERTRQFEQDYAEVDKATDESHKLTAQFYKDTMDIMVKWDKEVPELEFYLSEDLQFHQISLIQAFFLNPSKFLQNQLQRL